MTVLSVPGWALGSGSKFATPTGTGTVAAPAHRPPGSSHPLTPSKHPLLVTKMLVDGGETLRMVPLRPKLTLFHLFEHHSDRFLTV